MKKRNAPGRWKAVRSSTCSQVFAHPHRSEPEFNHPQQAVAAGETDRTSLRTLLVPLDGSLEAEHALPRALAIARRSDATLRLVHVYTRPSDLQVWQWQMIKESTENDKRNKRDYLREVAERIARTDGVRVETILIHGTDVDESLSTAASGADLVVMASRRRGRLRRLCFPGVDDRLRRTLTKPVLFVAGYSAPVDLTGDPIARHILVPLDGSLLAERILEPAAELAGLAAARMTLVNVQNPGWTSGVFEHTSPSGYLAGAAGEVVSACPDVDAQVVTTSRSTAHAIAAYAERRQVDLISVAAPLDHRAFSFMRAGLVDSLLARTDLPVLALGVDTARKRPAIMTVVE